MIAQRENELAGPTPSSVIVPGGFGRAFRARKGDYMIVVDLQGGQCADLWVLDVDDLDHYMSPPHTMVEIGSLQPRVGDPLMTNRRVPIMTLAADDVGQHDMLYPACDKQRYERYFGVTDHRNCHDNFLEAMEAYDWGSRIVPNPPLNLFMNTRVEPDGSVVAGDLFSEAGDRVVFRAEIDVVGVVSACPMDLTPTGSRGVTDLQIIVSEKLDGRGQAR